MVESPPTEVQLPFHATRDLATEAAKQLTYALVNPQPAGPFSQVGDDQLMALKKFTAIFEGTLPTHKQRTSTPLLNNTSKSPQRVDINESPHKGHMPAAAPRVLEPTASNQITPNSHRRLQTTPHRFVTPITPHQMARRSAGPLIMSQDILDETVQQENHIFSFPIIPSSTPVIAQPTKNKQMIIMP
jgi:hypothetical protein